MAYTTITRTEFETFLKRINRNVRTAILPGVFEFVYDLPIFKHPKLFVRIYSSINTTGEQESREYGTDALRVVVQHVDYKKPIYPFPDTKRMDGWQDRMKEKIFDGFEVGDHLMCTCGNYLAVRNHDGKTFLGCLSYPSCKNSRSSVPKF